MDKTKCTTFHIILVSFILLLAGGGVTITEQQKGRILNEHVRDQSYQQGFTLTPLTTDSVKAGGGFAKTFRDTLAFGNDPSNPIWRLSQWGSKYSLEGARPTEGDDGSITYSNPGKKVALYPDHSLLLEVNASREFDDARKDGEAWPALLMGQALEDAVAVDQANKIIFSMALQLVKSEFKMSEEEYNPDLHTAHTLLYLVVQNKNIHSNDHNDYFYFGIRSYDYRYPNLVGYRPGLHGRDKGNNRYMYQMALDDMWGNITFNDKNWHKGELNVKPNIKKALETLHSEDVFTDTEMSDLKITRISFGWEVPGTFDVAIKVKDMSLKTVTYEK